MWYYCLRNPNLLLVAAASLYVPFGCSSSPEGSEDIPISPSLVSKSDVSDGSFSLSRALQDVLNKERLHLLEEVEVPVSSDVICHAKRRSARPWVFSHSSFAEPIASRRLVSAIHWSGYCKNLAASRVDLTAIGKRLFGRIEGVGSVQMGGAQNVGRSWVLQPAGPQGASGSSRYLARFSSDDETIRPHDEEDSISLSVRSSENTERQPEPRSDGPPRRIDVLMAYTPNVLEWYRGEPDAVDAEMLRVVTQINEILDSSGVVHRLHLSGTHLVDFEETTSHYQDLERLRVKTDGYMDDVHAVRDEVGADLVQLVVKGFYEVSGLGYVGTGYDPTYGFSLSKNVLRTHAHEIGHNLGLAHPVREWRSEGFFSYSRGYERDGISTLMTPYGRLDLFSNPNLEHEGKPMGDADTANAALSLNQMSHVVASFRHAACTVSEDCTDETEVFCISEVGCVECRTNEDCPSAMPICDEHHSCAQSACGACDEGTFCLHAVPGECGRYSELSSCTLKPEVCSTDWKPVCGCDGETYGNSCLAHQAGMSVRSDGACARPASSDN